MSDPSPSRRLAGTEILADGLVRELLTARLVGVLATFSPDGAIHAVPMWYAGDEDVVVLATGSRSRKVRNLDADRRATLVLHDSRPGYEVCGASLAGEAEIVRGARARALVDLVHDRYVESRAAESPAVLEYLASDDAAVRLRPLLAWTWDERGSEASKALRSMSAALPLVPTDPRP